MNTQNNLMKGKRGVVMGVANDRSIAWGISKALAESGAEIAFTYQGEALEKRVLPLAQSLGSDTVLPCDVTDEASVDHLFQTLKDKWGKIDFIVHAIAFSDKEQLKGRYADTTRDNFLNTMDVSCFSFVTVAKRAAEIMNESGSMLSLSYYGAEKVVPHYNVMGVAKAALEASVKYLSNDFGKQGIRVNAISAGPIRTLAAAGIGDFRYILKWNEFNSPLRRNVTIDEVGHSALYMLSDLSSAVTGEVHHVDSGYHTVGMKNIDAPDISKAS